MTHLYLLVRPRLLPIRNFYFPISSCSWSHPNSPIGCSWRYRNTDREEKPFHRDKDFLKNTNSIWVIGNFRFWPKFWFAYEFRFQSRFRFRPKFRSKIQPKAEIFDWLFYLIIWKMEFFLVRKIGCFGFGLNIGSVWTEVSVQN